jgi:ElaB/YqjD/DUF883 family membrane-anchored ribosome-binding protein
MADTNVKNLGKNAADQASGLIGDAAEVARDIAGRGRDAVQSAGERVQSVAGELATQAGVAAETLYGRSTEARDYVERAVAANPFPALLIAGAIGYGIACLAHRR